jgi:hypothetical protein
MGLDNSKDIRNIAPQQAAAFPERKRCDREKRRG